MRPRAAFLIAVAAHEGQNDKCGEPYIFHPLAVAEKVKALGEDYEVVALLHDVFEDTPLNVENLEGDGDEPVNVSYRAWKNSALSEDQARSLRAITQGERETYFDYIRRVKKDFVGRVVKIADLRHNLSPERQDKLSAQQAGSLATRYKKALRILEDAE